MKNYTSRRPAPEPAKKQAKPQNFTFAIMLAITLIWGVLIFGFIFLQDISGRTGENRSNLTPDTTEVEPILSVKFTDENGLSREENRGVIQVAAEVVRLVQERGFRVEEVIVPQGYLREFNLIMSRELAIGNPDNPNPNTPDNPDSSDNSSKASIRIRCSTVRLASASASDAIYVFDQWLDGEIQATDYIDVRTPRRAFYR
ncbi:hypothetical protein FWG76_02245 [Candidatus Saccharibacteria bacterium]|nr:hypothetical protein [Candidatus Saccharibacteria bacterium]